jgi:putative membrane protein
MRKPIGITVLLGLVLIPAWLSLGAQDKAGQDEDFVRKASAADVAEIELGKLASQNAGSPEVKQFGQTMVGDHSKASQELAAIAKKKGFKVSTQMDQKHQEAFGQLSKLKGADFDRKYMAQMVMDHQEAADLFETQAAKGQDADLKNFAAKTVPVIRHHLKHAQQLASNVGADKSK